MDSNHCSGNKYADAINELLNSGKLTPQEATRRLSNAVDKELAKAPADISESFIATCEDLIYAINNEREYISHAEASRQELEVKIEKKERRSSIYKRVLAVSSIAAMLLVGVIMGDGILHREWLSGTSTPDQQQFAVTGNVVDPGLVEGGHADITDETREITTDSFDEAVEVLGYTPLVPTWFPEGWEIKEYYAYAEEGFSRLSIDLVSESKDEELKYELRQYSDMETAEHAFEQNEHGDMELCNGWKIYFSINIERSAAVWLDGKTTYSLFGRVTKDEMKDIIISIERGNSI